MLNELMLKLKECNIYNTDIEEVEFYGGWESGLIVYSPSGECLQVIEHNKELIIVNEYLSEVVREKNMLKALDVVLKCYCEKIEEINNSGNYISIDDFISQFNKM